MFCANCGKQLNSGGYFCQYCGYEVNPNSNKNAPVSEGGHVEARDQTDRSLTKISSEGAEITGEIRKLGASPLFFAGIILRCANAVLEFASALSGNSIYAYFSDAGSAAVLGGTIGFIMAAVQIFGMATFYRSNKLRKSCRIDTRGLSVCRFMAVTRCALTAVFFVVVVLSVVVVRAAFIESYENFSTAVHEADGVGLIIYGVLSILLAMSYAISLGLIGACFIAFIFACIFYMKLAKTVKSIMITARTKTITGNISMYVIIMLFVSAVLGFVLQFSWTDGFLLVVVALVRAATNIVFGTILIRYRKLYKNAGASGKM